MAANSAGKTPTTKQGKTEKESSEAMMPLTRSFVLSPKVSEEINKRAEAEDRSASKIVDRALAAHFNLA